jgi:hypothetical protein
MEAEVGAADRAFGFEWSAPGAGITPYARFTAARSDGATRLHPLFGLRLPIPSRWLSLVAGARRRGFSSE